VIDVTEPAFAVIDAVQGISLVELQARRRCRRCGRK